MSRQVLTPSITNSGKTLLVGLQAPGWRRSRLRLSFEQGTVGIQPVRMLRRGGTRIPLRMPLGVPALGAPHLSPWGAPLRSPGWFHLAGPWVGHQGRPPGHFWRRAGLPSCLGPAFSSYCPGPACPPGGWWDARRLSTTETRVLPAGEAFWAEILGSGRVLELRRDSGEGNAGERPPTRSKTTGCRHVPRARETAHILTLTELTFQGKGHKGQDTQNHVSEHEVRKGEEGRNFT